MDQSAATLRDLVAFLARSEAVAKLGLSIDPHVAARLSVPDSRVSRETEELCRRVSSPALANHCFRSYAWGVLLGRAGPIVGWDPERLYAAAMLHDIGLTPSYDRGGCFERDGAEAARELLHRLGWDPQTCEVVANAIYLHMHDVREDDTGEARLLALGTTADVSGGRADEIDREARNLTLALFPRLDLKREFIALFEDQAKRKPHCSVAKYMANGLGERIMNAPYDG